MVIGGVAIVVFVLLSLTFCQSRREPHFLLAFVVLSAVVLVIAGAIGIPALLFDMPVTPVSG